MECLANWAGIMRKLLLRAGIISNKYCPRAGIITNNARPRAVIITYNACPRAVIITNALGKALWLAPNLTRKFF